MKLSQLRVHNYRSIKDAVLAVSDMLILLGPNNHGKSNVLSAIEFGLSSSAKPASDDFFAFRSDDDPSLWVEMTFDRLTEQEQTTFQKYARADGTLCIRKTARLGEYGGVEVAYNGYVQEPLQWWLQNSAGERLGSRSQIEQEAQQVPQLSALLDAGGRVSRAQIEEFQRQYIEEHRGELEFVETLEEGPLLGQKNVAAGILPELFLVPAVRDLSDETKVKTTTVFGRLLQRAVREMTERDSRFVELRGRLQSLVDELNARPEDSEEERSELARLEAAIGGELALWGVGVSIEVLPPELEKVFELGTQLHLDDGLKTLAEKKGHGLQRAVLLALLRAWANALRSVSAGQAASSRQASESAYFAMEEPELFLHPHAQRQLFGSLGEIAATPDHQVFICTHSTHFVDLEQYRSIAIVSKHSAKSGTEIRQCSGELFEGPDATHRKYRFRMASWINPDRSELFFADRVVLVEGETEKAVFPYLADKIGAFNAAVSVIDCGGKHNLALYITILNAFRVPYLVVHDEDPLPDPIPANWNQEKRASARRVYEANTKIAQAVDSQLGTIEMLVPDFEHVSGVSQNQAAKKSKPVAALDHLDTVNLEEMPRRLVAVVRSAYGVMPPEEQQP